MMMYYVILMLIFMFIIYVEMRERESKQARNIQIKNII
jgi:uncharacterized membrane protein